MSSTVYLHELDDFSDLISAVSYEKKIHPQLVEKDYWIMHCLYGLKRLGLSFELKGGTSLSKGFGIIQRFSEDIDIRIEPPQEMDVKYGANHKKPIHVESRRRFYEWLTTDKIVIPGIESVKRDHAFDNNKLTSAGIRLTYASRLLTLEGLKPGVLLEVGFDDTLPNRPVTISSWVLEKAHQVGAAFIDNRALEVKCYSPAYTFVEKLQTVSTKFRKQQEQDGFPVNFLRHYYDIYCLLNVGEVQDFISTVAYEDRKRQRFPEADNRCIAQNQAFLLENPETRAQYAAEYDSTRDLYYEGMVPFGEILERIRENIHRL